MCFGNQINVLQACASFIPGDSPGATSDDVLNLTVALKRRLEFWPDWDHQTTPPRPTTLFLQLRTAPKIDPSDHNKILGAEFLSQVPAVKPGTKIREGQSSCLEACVET